MAGVEYFKTAHHNQIVQMKYKSKYRKLKKLIKNYVFENAALCDEISQIQESITKVKEERSFLLLKLIENDSDPDVEKLRRYIQSQPPPNPDGTPVHIPGKRGPKKRLNPDGSVRKNKTSNSNNKKLPTSQQIKTNIPNCSELPTLPIHLNNFTLKEIGEIPENNENFHTENWIYPVGYIATRVYAHPKEPERKCTFTCKILYNGGYPQFQVIPDADYDSVFFGKTPDICHLAVLETICSSLNVKNLPLQPQGELFFGLGCSAVKAMLQNSPNTKKCQNFKSFPIDSNYGDNDPTLSFDALQKLITISSYHSVPEIKEEPPDELLEK